MTPKTLTSTIPTHTHNNRRQAHPPAKFNNHPAPSPKPICPPERDQPPKRSEDSWQTSGPTPPPEPKTNPTRQGPLRTHPQGKSASPLMPPAGACTSAHNNAHISLATRRFSPGQPPTDQPDSTLRRTRRALDPSTPPTRRIPISSSRPTIITRTARARALGPPDHHATPAQSTPATQANTTHARHPRPRDRTPPQHSQANQKRRRRKDEPRPNWTSTSHSPCITTIEEEEKRRRRTSS